MVQYYCVSLGASWSMKSSLRAVRMAWGGEGGGTGGDQNTSLSASGEVNEGREGGKEERREESTNIFVHSINFS